MRARSSSNSSAHAQHRFPADSYFFQSMMNPTPNSNIWFEMTLVSFAFSDWAGFTKRNILLDSPQYQCSYLAFKAKSRQVVRRFRHLYSDRHNVSAKMGLGVISRPWRLRRYSVSFGKENLPNRKLSLEALVSSSGELVSSRAEFRSALIIKDWVSTLTNRPESSLKSLTNHPYTAQGKAGTINMNTRGSRFTRV